MHAKDWQRIHGVHTPTLLEHAPTLVQRVPTLPERAPILLDRIFFPWDVGTFCPPSRFWLCPPVLFRVSFLACFRFRCANARIRLETAGNLGGVLLTTPSETETCQVGPRYRDQVPGVGGADTRKNLKETTWKNF